MDAPTWEFIGLSLKLVLSRYDLDLSNLGSAQRIDHKDFEQIFYHLFMTIDPADTKRKFWSIYPSRNPEERTRFIETSLQMINGKQMSPYRASLAQLKMLGGGPFRRLLGSLIEKAAESEIQHVLKKYPGCSIEVDSNIDTNIKRLEKLQRDIADQLPIMKESIKKYKSLQETMNIMNHETNETLEMLNIKAFRELDGCKSDAKHVKEMFKSLLIRLERTSLRKNAAIQKIKQISIPVEDSFESNLPTTPNIGKKRISEYFKEMREFLALSPDCDRGDNKSKMLDKISERLKNYDDGVDNLITLWEDEQERADEAMLEIPEMRERYEFFEKLIPKISFTPISFDPVESK